MNDRLGDFYNRFAAELTDESACSLGYSLAMLALKMGVITVADWRMAYRYFVDRATDDILMNAYLSEY